MRDYIPIMWENCPEPTAMKIFLRLPKSNLDNQILFQGDIIVSEEISGNIDFVLENYKCNLDMTKCDQAINQNIPEICKKFKEKNTFYSKAFQSIQPPMECPIKPGNYTLGPILLDLTIVSMLPIDGYVWIVNFKLASSVKGNKTKKLAMCLNSEVKVIKRRVKS